jgi:hypothetical protein
MERVVSAEPHCPRELDERFASAPVRHRRLHDAPLIAERAATCGRSALEGGDERAGVKRRHPFELEPRQPDHRRKLEPLAANRTPKRVRQTHRKEPTSSAPLDVYPRNGTQNPAFQQPVSQSVND